MSVETGRFIRILNAADIIADQYRIGRLDALTATEEVVELGFYNVVFDGQKVAGVYDGVAYKLGRRHVIEAGRI